MKKNDLHKATDILLLTLFFAELAGLFLPSLLHECLGIGFFGLLIWHNRENFGFYKTIGRGSYNFKRLTNIGSILLLGVGAVLLLVSGLALTHWFPAIFTNYVNWRSLHLGAAGALLFLLFIHSLIHARRYITEKVFYGVTAALFVMAACATFALPYFDRWYHQVIVRQEEIVSGEKVPLPGKTVIVYFSRVGNTDFPADVDAVSGASVMRDESGLIGNAQMIAYMVQDATGGDIFAIRTLKKYPADYAATTVEGKRELDTGELPVLQPEPMDFVPYSVIVLVYPLWWDTLPMAAKSFLHDHDLTGKTIVPIVTHGGGGAGDSVEELARSTQGTAKTYLEIYSSDIPASRQRIADYLRDIKISLEAGGR